MMESFIFSAAMSFVLYQCLAYAKWPVPKSRFPIGPISITFRKASPAWASRIMRAILVLAVLFCVLLIHDLAFSSDIISRNRSNIILGFLFGPIFGIWINSVLRDTQDDGLTKGQIVGGVGLILLFIVGSVGNEAGNLIQKVTHNISSLKLGGAEFSFTDKGRKDATPGAGSLPPGGRGNEGTSSNGLLYLTNLDTWYIERDRKYLTKLFPVRNALLVDRLRAAEAFATTMVRPPFGCLSGWLKSTGDAASVNLHLGAFAHVFRQINSLDTNDRRREVSAHFIRRSLAIASDIVEFAAPKEVDDACAPLLQEFCPDTDSAKILEISRPKKFEIPRPANAMQICINSRKEQLASIQSGEADPLLRKLIDEYARHLRQFSQDRAVEQHPYFAIGHASAMAQLGRYEAAGAILYDWLEAKNKSKPADGWKTPDDWFEIRARSIIAAYFEEWVRRDADRTATAVRDEHLQNLHFLRKNLKQRLIANNVFFSELLRDKDENQSLSPTRPSGCGFQHKKHKHTLLWRALFRSYISMELTYLQNTLLHPKYKENFAKTTTNDLRWLAQIDLSCIPEKDGPEVIYAQILEAFTRNAVQYSETRKNVEADETRKKRLTEAKEIAQFALELVVPAIETTQGRQEKQFLSRISSSDAVTTQESLKEALNKLEVLKAD